MRFTLNGRAVDLATRPDERLLEALRDGCGLRSLKDGCAPEGSCGACTVIVEGRAVVSCAQPADRVAGRSVTTLEGLAPEARRAWAAAFADVGASQCGFCSPGLILKAEAFLSRSPGADRRALAHAITGNVCRCTGYVKVLDALERVAAERRAGHGDAPGRLPRAASAPGGGVGARAPLVEAPDLALGRRAFVADLTVPGMLHAALRFADHPRAVVRQIDVSRAAAAPEVVRVATWRDIPGERFQGLLTPDWPLFVAEDETTRYVGDVVAAVVATSGAAARAAAALVDVDWEVLRPVTSPDEALATNAPPLHPAGNLLSTSGVRRGDVDAALASSAHIVTETFTTQRIEHAFLEPEAALALAGADLDLPGHESEAGGVVVRVFSQGQGVWEDRRQIASLLGLPPEAVRVTHVPTGGAFGGKEDLGAQGHAALLAWLTGRPVMLRLSRAESLRFHPKRHPFRMDYTVGCDAGGRLTAVRARIVGDTGAYASVGAKVLERAAGHACGAYRVPNVDVEARAVYTNNPPAGAMRGFGVPQVTFAIEGMIDRLAELTGLDGWEIRWRNALEAGDRFGTGQRLGPGVGLKRTLLAVRDAYRGARFAGIACGAKNTGIGNGVIERGRAVLRVEADRSVRLFHSWSEMGQGIDTALRQIAAEELDMPAERIHVAVDTEHELDAGETTASRATTLGGLAVIDAARRLRTALRDRSLQDLVGREFAGEHVVDWTTATPETPQEADDGPGPQTHMAYGWATQVVVLDDAGRVDRVVAAQDVGRAINPQILEGQVEGGVHMGLGYALTEAFEVEEGRPVTTTLKSLGIIPADRMPPVEAILVEEPQPEGPYGAKGAGEAVLVPTAAAVAGALHAFDGRFRNRLPMRDSPAARALLRPGAAAATTGAGDGSAAGGPDPADTPAARPSPVGAGR